MGAVAEPGARAVALTAVDPIPLPGGSWSAMVLSDRTLSGNRASLGYSVFMPNCVTALVCHEVEELAYVISGRGELRLAGGGTVPFEADQGLFIPAGTWHAVANTGDQHVVMVFGFPHPDYPPTDRREA